MLSSRALDADPLCPGIVSRPAVPSARGSAPAIGSCGLDLTETLKGFVRDRGEAFRELARFIPGDHYNRELVYSTGDLELWLLSWMPGQVSTIHDHGGAITVTTILSGSLYEERFEPIAGCTTVRPSWTSLRGVGEVDPIDPTEIHRVTPIGRVVTLHLYAPTCPDGRVYHAA